MAVAVPMKEVRPYGSIVMQAPQSWFQDGTAREYCFYYYPAGGGPPTLHVRRDDFVYKPEDGAPPPGAMKAATGGDAATEELYQRFAELVPALDQPDIVGYSKEPRSPIGQVVRYNRQGELNGQPGVAHWWLRAIKTHDSFTVLTCTLELYADGYVNPETQALINAIDRSVAEARILSLEEAAAMAPSAQEVAH
ncbi:MAG: hypothetical protein AAF684_11985 [Pseudomonadota bacterium]